MEKKQVLAEFNRLIEVLALSKTQKDTIRNCITDVLNKVYTDDKNEVIKSGNTVPVKPLTKDSNIVDVISTVNLIMYNLKEQGVLCKN